MKKAGFLTAAATAAGVSTCVLLPQLAAAVQPTAADIHSDAATRTDFTRLSVAGNKAFDDVGMARLAIFDGKPARAEALIAAAETAFNRATADRTSFVKAEDRLNPPSALHQPAPASETDRTGPIAWIPVGESFVLDETLTQPEDAANTLEKANDSLRASHRQAAATMLKVANIGAIDTVALLPLDAGAANLHRAAELMSSGDYYGANQALRQLETDVRYDTVETSSGPKTAATSAASMASDHTKQP